MNHCWCLLHPATGLSSKIYMYVKPDAHSKAIVYKTQFVSIPINATMNCKTVCFEFVEAINVPAVVWALHVEPLNKSSATSYELFLLLNNNVFGSDIFLTSVLHQLDLWLQASLPQHRFELQKDIEKYYKGLSKQ